MRLMAPGMKEDEFLKNVKKPVLSGRKREGETGYWAKYMGGWYKAFKG